MHPLLGIFLFFIFVDLKIYCNVLKSCKFKPNSEEQNDQEVNNDSKSSEEAPEQESLIIRDVTDKMTTSSKPDVLKIQENKLAEMKLRKTLEQKRQDFQTSPEDRLLTAKLNELEKELEIEIQKSINGKPQDKPENRLSQQQSISQLQKPIIIPHDEIVVGGSKIHINLSPSRIISVPPKTLNSFSLNGESKSHVQKPEYRPISREVKEIMSPLRSPNMIKEYTPKLPEQRSSQQHTPPQPMARSTPPRESYDEKPIFPSPMANDSPRNGYFSEKQTSTTPKSPKPTVKITKIPMKSKSDLSPPVRDYHEYPENSSLRTSKNFDSSKIPTRKNY